jgi:hypothetical protein
MNCYKHLLTLVFLTICHCALAQETEKSVQITQGLFLTFEDFKKNTPVTEKSIVTSYPNDTNFYYDLLSDDKINIQSKTSGSAITTALIWGYFDGKGLYLNVKNFPSFISEGKDGSAPSWAPVVEIGKICLIHYNENFDLETGTFNPEMGTKQAALFLMDTRDGSIHEANAANLADLIQDDPKVLGAFNNYQGDDEGRLNTFLKIYNERHKLELP